MIEPIIITKEAIKLTLVRQGLAFTALLLPLVANSAMPKSEILLATLNTEYGLQVSRVTSADRYNNQPLLTEKGIYFTQEVKDQGESQTDLVFYSFADQQSYNLTNSPVSEYSPTLTPSGDALSSIVVEPSGQQKLWQYPLESNEQPSRIFEWIEPVGYHAWGRDNDVVMFILGEPHTLQYTSVAAAKGEVVASDIGRTLIYNKDFYVGYSPERINPGDKLHTIDKILKVTSGSTPKVAEQINRLYARVITAGTYMAPSIKVAEAAKVIENSQRDINIAFVNELAKIFNLMNIDTKAVLEAAGTKWNFLPFKPGLVGGHCIGVDPYYLAQKAQEVGYHPEIILAGRRVNDSMGQYVASEVIKLMAKNNISINGAKILVLGITFKENCPDVRNTKAVDVINQLKSYGTQVTVLDPWASPTAVVKEYQLDIIKNTPKDKYDAIVLTVAHKEFIDLNLKTLIKPKGIIYDVKGVLNDVDGRL